ncbi:uncharacterized protein PHA67_015270 [Liasis olivaceus]
MLLPASMGSTALLNEQPAHSLPYLQASVRLAKQVGGRSNLFFLMSSPALHHQEFASVVVGRGQNCYISGIQVSFTQQPCGVDALDFEECHLPFIQIDNSPRGLI